MDFAASFLAYVYYDFGVYIVVGMEGRFGRIQIGVLLFPVCPCRTAKAKQPPCLASLEILTCVNPDFAEMPCVFRCYIE